MKITVEEFLSLPMSRGWLQPDVSVTWPEQPVER
jgi:hypothetical protein